MITAELKQRLDLWLDGELPIEEVALLQSELENSPDAVAFLADRAILNELLVRAAATEPIAGESRVQPAPPQSRRWFLRTSTWAAAAAAVATLFLVSLAMVPKAAASPMELVQRALAACQALLDRRYTVEIEPNTVLRRGPFRQRTATPASTLWVRGSQFVQIFDSPVGKLVWGRDVEGAVWFTLSERAGAIFKAGEVPEQLEEICELRTLDLQNLLENLLSDFELEQSSQERDNYRIEARPKPGRKSSKFGPVELEMERGTSLVRRASVERLIEGRTVAVVSFSLEEVASQNDSLYEMKTYLQPDAEVLDRSSRRGRRSELLREFMQQIRK
jgi:hypothetical protein